MKPVSLLRQKVFIVLLSFFCFVDASAKTRVKPEPQSTSNLLARSTDVIRGTIVGFTYRNMQRGSPDFLSESLVGGDDPGWSLEVQIRVDDVLYQMNDYTPTIRPGQIARLWVSPDKSKWLELLNQEKVFFLQYYGITGPENFIDGYSTRQWPDQKVNESELENLLRSSPPSRHFP